VYVQAQDSARHFTYKNYKETVFTIGYHYNFGDKVEGVRPPSFHFVEAGIWRSNVSTGHHPFTVTYYFANDFALNSDKFLIGPKVGGFFSVLIMGLGGELCYYTDFASGSLRFIPSVGLFTPVFKLTVNPHLILSNKNFQNLNKGHINLTVRISKISKRNQRAQ
jgi:hypothetical protein